MSKTKKKSVTQRLKEVLLNGKSLTEAKSVKMGASPRFLSKRVSEFRASGLNIESFSKRGVTNYSLVID
jgi:hypothetical protein